MPTSSSEKAVQYFLSGYNCAQSTAAAFAAECGLEVEAVLTMMSGFGAGLGGLRETCGAVSAMAYVAGLQMGAYAPDDIESKRRLYDRIKEMVQAFVEQHGTICCGELLEREACQAASNPSKRTPEYYAERPCARLVATAAEIISKISTNL
jgi:C_GCAxxG_C_C family probable redox protein